MSGLRINQAITTSNPQIVIEENSVNLETPVETQEGESLTDVLDAWKEKFNQKSFNAIAHSLLSNPQNGDPVSLTPPPIKKVKLQSLT